MTDERWVAAVLFWPSLNDQNEGITRSRALAFLASEEEEDMLLQWHANNVPMRGFDRSEVLAKWQVMASQEEAIRWAFEERDRLEQEPGAVKTEIPAWEGATF